MVVIQSRKVCSDPGTRFFSSKNPVLAYAMDRADMMTDERCVSSAARLQNADWVEEQIYAWTKQLTRAQIMEKLAGAIPAGPVQNMADIY